MPTCSTQFDLRIPAVMRRMVVLLLLIGGTASGANFSDSYRWTSTATDGGSLAQGDGITLRWSIANDFQPLTLNNSPVGNSNLVSFLDGIYGGAGSGGVGYSARPWFSIIESQFTSIASKTGLTFEYVADSGTAWNTSAATSGQSDIRLGGFDFPTLGELGRGALPAQGGDILLDTNNSSFESSTILGGILQHELGHSLGLLHVNVPGVPVLMTNQAIPTQGPQFDDLYALTRLYGDRLEKQNGNDTPVTASFLGTLSPGAAIVVGSSTDDGIVLPIELDFVTIDGTSDVDLYRVDIPFASEATISVLPRGPSYSFTPEGLAQQSITASALSNLRFRLLASDGTTPIANVNMSGIGAEERLNSFDLPSPGTYYVEVRGEQNLNQFYRLGVLAEPTASGQSRTVFIDQFDTAGDVNVGVDFAPRQGNGKLDSPYEFSAGLTPGGDPGVAIEEGKLVMRAVQGVVGVDSPVITPVRNIGTEVAGERWLLSFDLHLEGSMASADAGFALTLNDTWPIAEPFSDTADLSVLLTTNNGYRVVESGGNSPGDKDLSGTRAGPDYLVQMLVDETSATPRVTVALNGVTVLSNEAISLSVMERYFSLQLLTLSNLPSMQSVYAEVDNLSLTVLTGAISGDYNLDGVVNLADYTLWRDQLGRKVLPGTLADGNSNGTIDAADYTVWKNSFGLPASPSTAVTQVPEPTNILGAILSLVALSVARGSLLVRFTCQRS